MITRAALVTLAAKNLHENKNSASDVIAPLVPEKKFLLKSYKKIKKTDVENGKYLCSFLD